MLKFIIIHSMLFCGIAFGQQSSKFSEMKEPVAKRSPHEMTIHGHSRNDHYYWMSNRDSKDVLDYLNQENAYTKAYFSQFESLTSTMLNEFERRIDPNESSAQFVLNKKTYQLRNVEGKDYQQVYQLNGKSALLFLDQNQRAEKKSFYELADWAPSPDNSLLALSEDFIGRRKYSITFRNNKTGKFLKDKITDTDGSIVWANDNKTIFYVKKDPQTLREFQVFSHILGTDPSKDKLVLQEDDEKFSVHISKTTTGRYILINIVSSTTSEIRYIDANYPSGDALIFWKREKGHLYEVDHHEKGFYILTNKNADNRRLLFSPGMVLSLENCKEFIAHDPATLIESALVLKDYVITEERNNGLMKIRIVNLLSGKQDYVKFEEETYFTGLGLNDDYTANSIFFSYNSLTTPSTVYKLDLSKQSKEIIHRKELIDKTFKPDNYESKRIWATANDGSKIPVAIVYKKGTDLKNAPCLLYGYGSYGYTLPDVFSATRLSLLDRGFVYAVAHIRGSKYMGEHWYENGKFLKKVNTFTDFINAAEYLGMQGYCSPEKIYAQGGSAGGLLMGAVTNMAPYLWKGVIAQVPFVDVVTTMLDESIPLTVGEYEEWGNPNDEEYYWYLLNYSPYDNVKQMDYPSLYITTGYHDSQVQYWEPMKWVAKLRESRTNKNPLLFNCNMDAGHGGGSGRTNERLEIAKEYAFILDLEGIEK
jgi:oligopeptidase B